MNIGRPNLLGRCGAGGPPRQQGRKMDFAAVVRAAQGQRKDGVRDVNGREGAELVGGFFVF